MKKCEVRKPWERFQCHIACLWVSWKSAKFGKALPAHPLQGIGCLRRWVKGDECSFFSKSSKRSFYVATPTAVHDLFCGSDNFGQNCRFIIWVSGHRIRALHAVKTILSAYAPQKVNEFHNLDYTNRQISSSLNDIFLFTLGFCVCRAEIGLFKGCSFNGPGPLSFHSAQYASSFVWMVLNDCSITFKCICWN